MKVWVIRTNLGLSLTVPNYEFRKGQYGFYPMKLSRFAEKNEVLQKYQNFIRGPFQTGSYASRHTKRFKSQGLFWMVLGL